LPIELRKRHPPRHGAGLPGCPSRSQTEENVVPNGRRGVRSGVVRRLAELTALREVVSPDLAILPVDLAPAKQAAVACVHDSVVLRRPVFTGSAWCLEQIPRSARCRHRWPHSMISIDKGRGCGMVWARRSRTGSAVE